MSMFDGERNGYFEDKARESLALSHGCSPRKNDTLQKATSWLAISSDTDDSSCSESENNSDRAMRYLISL